MNTAAEKLDAYRQQINLVDFLEREGFRLDARKGTRRGKWVVMRDPATARKLVVRPEAGHYFNPQDDGDRGSVVDYVVAKLGVRPGDKEGWKRLFAYLDDYAGGTPTPVPTWPDREPSAPVVGAEPVPFLPRFQPLSDTEYLLGRGLTERTLSAPEFDRKIFGLTHVDRLGRRHLNTAFPLETETGVVGVVLRNHHLNLINGVKQDALWISNPPPGRVCTEVVVTESPIDALSYHQLHPPIAPGARVYVATAGTLTAGHPRVLQALLDRLRPARLVLGNDNDVEGIQYNLKLLATLSPPGAPPPVRAHYARAGRTAELHVEQPLDPGCPGQAEALRHWLLEPFRSRLGAEDATVNVVSKGAGDAATGVVRATLVVPKERPYLLKLERLVVALRGLKAFAEVRRPLEKDWNDELRAAGLKRRPLTPRLRSG